jgi:hypothetical protein
VRLGLLRFPAAVWFPPVLRHALLPGYSNKCINDRYAMPTCVRLPAAVWFPPVLRRARAGPHQPPIGPEPHRAQADAGRDVRRARGAGERALQYI